MESTTKTYGELVNELTKASFRPNPKPVLFVQAAHAIRRLIRENSALEVECDNLLEQIDKLSTTTTNEKP